MMRFWFDTEFIEDGKTIDLMAIGVVAEDGRTYYAEPEECDLTRAGEWVRANVIPHLTGPRKPRAVIARELVEFFGPEPEIWAYFAAYDWVALCQLYGTMMQLPETWPMFVRDLKAVGPAGLYQPDSNHNALQDAIWIRDAWTRLFDRRAA